MPDSAGHTIKSDWPEAPPDATYHGDNSIFTWQGYGFEVAAAPPPPFPFGDGPYPVDKYGPPGTIWIFSVSDLFSNYTGLPAGLTRAAFKRLIRKLGTYSVGGALEGWRTPDPDNRRDPPMVDAIRATVHGKIGTSEEVAHVFHFVTAPVAGVAQTADNLRTFGGQVRDAWAGFFNTGDNNAAAFLFSPELVYDEVRLAYLRFTAGAKKPEYLTPTQYVPIAAGAVKGKGQQSMPYEVAACMSLGSNLRGPRFRGRSYLGPLATNIMGAAGMFAPASIGTLGTAFGTLFVSPLNTGTGNDMHIVSAKYGTSVPVQGVRVGQVPDSQRRRRKSLEEAYVLAWGTAVGAAV